MSISATVTIPQPIAKVIVLPCIGPAGPQGPQGEPGEGGASAWDDLTGTANHVPFDTTPTSVPTGDGVIYWDTDEQCLSYRVPGGSSEINKEIWDYYTNISGVAMVDGDIVSVSGVSGNRTAVVLTNFANEASVKACIGMVTNGAANNGQVRVTKIGTVKGLSTTGEGNRIYGNVTTPGKWQTTEPTSGWVASIGIVKVAHAVVGVVDVDLTIYRYVSSVGSNIIQAASQPAAQSAIGLPAGTAGKAVLAASDYSGAGSVRRLIGLDTVNTPTFAGANLSLGEVNFTSTNSYSFNIGGARYDTFWAKGFRFPSSENLTWCPGSVSFNTAPEIGIRRVSSNTLEICGYSSVGPLVPSGNLDLKLRNAIQTPGIGTTVTPTANGDLVMESTSNTSVTIKLRGSDGFVRTAVLTLT